MTLEELKTLAETYGADLSRWPAEDGEAASVLLMTSVEAQRALACAAALDHAIRPSKRHKPSKDLVDRILNAID